MLKKCGTCSTCSQAIGARLSGANLKKMRNDSSIQNEILSFNFHIYFTIAYVAHHDIMENKLKIKI